MVTVKQPPNTAEPGEEPTGAPTVHRHADAARADGRPQGARGATPSVRRRRPGSSRAAPAKMRVFVDDELVDTLGFFSFDGKLVKTHAWPRSLRGQDRRAPGRGRGRRRHAARRLPRRRVLVVHALEVEAPRRRGRCPRRRATRPSSSGASSPASLEHRPDERPHHVPQEAVGRDLKSSSSPCPSQTAREHGAGEDAVLRLGRRERAEVVLARG